MLYFPEISGLPRRPADNPARYRSPEEHQVPFENLYIECEDGVSIHAWLLLRTKEKNDRPTLVFFHGNAGNIGLRIPNALHMLQHLNANVLMVEYRGYGDSDSVKPNEKGLKLDAQAALKFISKHPKVDSSKIFLFGRSLGGKALVGSMVKCFLVFQKFFQSRFHFHRCRRVRPCPIRRKQRYSYRRCHCRE